MRKSLSHPSLFFLCLTLFCFFSQANAANSSYQTNNKPRGTHLLAKAKSLVKNGCFIIQTTPFTLVSYHADQLFSPASIWKITTAATALSVLGPEYSFKTEFYQDSRGGLYIKGYGDPFLVSEEIELIALELREKHVQPITGIYIDQSAFILRADKSWQGESDNPYDAGNYALSVNFNTINVTIDQQGLASSAEPQTPTLEIMRRLSLNLGKGTQRINISQQRHRVNEYARELFWAKIFSGSKTVPSQEEIEKQVPSGAKHILSHYSSKKLPETVAAMLQYSNNFIANQLFLTCGAEKNGFPGDWQKAILVMNDFLLNQIGLDKEEFKVTEGSGLSRSNKVTGRAMLEIVRHFTPYANLLPQMKAVKVKSGTLTGVYSYAGYRQTENQEMPFVIILNQKSNTRDAILNLFLNNLTRQEEE